MNWLVQLWKPFVAALGAGAIIGSLGTTPATPVAPPSTPEPPPPPETPPSLLETLATIRDADLPSHYDSTAGKDRDMVARFWARASPATFLDHLTAGSPPFFSSPQHALYLFDTWAARDFAAALEAADNLSPFNPLRLHVQHRVVAAKYVSDPATATAALAGIWSNNGSPNTGLIPFLDDPPNALGLLARLPSTDVARSAISKGLETWAATDPLAALAWAQENAAPVAPVIAAAWETDPASALALIPRITSPRARSRTVRNLAVNVIDESDPATAVTLIDSHLDGWTRNEAAARLATKTAHKNPRAAADLALTFKSASARSAALATALEAFHRDAPTSLEHWLAELPAGPAKTAAESALRKIADRTPPPTE